MFKPRATLATLALLLLPGCVLSKIDAIIDHYDTFGSTDASSTSTDTGTTNFDTSTGADTSTASSSTTSTASSAIDTGTSANTTADPSTSAADTSTGPGPTCGDGVVNLDIEECDDGNFDDDDGCLSICARVWTVFVTSDPVSQGDLKGLLGAEYECRHRAVKAGLPNGERYLPWLSTSASQPIDRFHRARGPYRRVDGVQIAADWQALTSGTLENPIIIDENGDLQDTLVITDTLLTGQRLPGVDYCDDWTSISGKKKLWAGASEATNGDWTHAVEGTCQDGGALYCFEQP